MKKSMAIFLLNMALIMVMSAQSKDKHFGEVFVQINDEPEQAFIAETAVLYRNVSVDYDTTIYVKTGDVTDHLYSPQLKQGDNYILHLILTAQEVAPGENTPLSYDLYFKLGKTLQEQVQISGADSGVFVHSNGILKPERLYSANQQAVFNLLLTDENSAVGGNFQTEFDYPVPGREGEISHIKIRGELDIPEGNVKVGEETNIGEQKARKKRMARNIVFAVIMTAFIVLFAVR